MYTFFVIDVPLIIGIIIFNYYASRVDIIKCLVHLSYNHICLRISDKFVEEKIY
jgi:hypothetical protein